MYAKETEEGRKVIWFLDLEDKDQDPAKLVEYMRGTHPHKFILPKSCMNILFNKEFIKRAYGRFMFMGQIPKCIPVVLERAEYVQTMNDLIDEGYN